MKQFFLTVLGVFTGLVLFLVVVPVVLLTFAIAAGSSKPVTPAASVLELDLRQGISDQPSTDPFAVFSGSGLSVLQVVDTLIQAQDDRNVKGLLIRLPESGITPATADELRQAYRELAEARRARWQRLAQRLGVPLLPLIPARPHRLPDAACWGRYYHTDPWVCALQDSMQPLRFMPRRGQPLTGARPE